MGIRRRAQKEGDAGKLVESSMLGKETVLANGNNNGENRGIPQEVIKYGFKNEADYKIGQRPENQQVVNFCRIGR